MTTDTRPRCLGWGPSRRCGNLVHPGYRRCPHCDRSYTNEQMRAALAENKSYHDLLLPTVGFRWSQGNGHSFRFYAGTPFYLLDGCLQGAADGFKRGHKGTASDGGMMLVSLDWFAGVNAGLIYRGFLPANLAALGEEVDVMAAEWMAKAEAAAFKRSENT